VVTAVKVQEGETVRPGQVLVQLDKTPLHTQLATLSEQRQELLQEMTALRIARQGETPAIANLTPEIQSRIDTRSLLTAQLASDPASLTPEQRQRYDLFQQQLTNRQSLNQLQTSNLETQIAATDAQSAQTQYQLQVEQGLLDQLQPLVQQGAIPRADALERSVNVNALRNQINQANLQKSQLQINQQQTQIETQRLQTEAYQSVQQQLAELDRDFDTTIQTNQRQLVQVAAQIKQVQHDLQSQDLRAPVEGVVFNLVHKLPGVVAQPGQVLLQVVPKESLVARVQIANADIANIREGMAVDVRIDAYPFTEFGSIPGRITRVSREAMPSTAQGPTLFPIEVKLEESLRDRQGNPLAITPGMTVSANIKVRSRTPISYVADELIKALDGARSVK
jgi:HlyD family secretion protein